MLPPAAVFHFRAIFSIAVAATPPLFRRYCAIDAFADAAAFARRHAAFAAFIYFRRFRCRRDADACSRRPADAAECHMPDAVFRFDSRGIWY